MKMMPEKEASKTLALPSAEKLQRLDETARKYSGALAASESPFTAAVTLAGGIQDLRELLTPDIMTPIMKLMNSPLGFLTDRNGRPNKRGEVKPLYSAETVRDCVIEAILRGFQPVGNQFNILADRFYGTQAGYKAKVLAYPGVTNFKDEYELPRSVGSGHSVSIKCWATWEKNGEPGRLDRQFIIRGDDFATADSYLGKCKRKLLHDVYETLSGVASPEGEVSDQELPVVEPKELPQRRQRMPKPTFNQQPPVAEAVPEETAPEGQHAATPEEAATPPAPKEEPEFVAETAHETIAVEVHKRGGWTQSRFIDGLRLLGWELPENAKIVADLPDRVASMVAQLNFTDLLREIEDQEWIAGSEAAK
jgi:hypothetical protein